jgi:glycine/D-amino acid oxidase-like deaminating enzyme/nitrite reductase/ring-hydroxylating ferredoxin subunit
MDTLRPTTSQISERRDGSQKSLWENELKKLSGNSQSTGSLRPVDVVIVGGGITGITTALLLQRQGKSCIIAEAHRIGFGTTGGTTAHINTFADTTYAEVEKDFGEKEAALFAKGISDAVAQIREFVRAYSIDCDLSAQPAYVYAETKKEEKELNDLFASAQRAGVAVKETSTVPTPIPFRKAIVFDDNAQFHPAKYIRGLLDEFHALGGITLENTLVESIDTKEDYLEVQAGATVLTTRNVVYATHLPPGFSTLDFFCAPYRSYVVAARLKDESRYPNGLIYDMQEPYHYFRTHEIEGINYLIAGGHDHKTGHSDEHESLQDLETYLRSYYDIESIDYQWSSQYYIPADGLPYIGSLPGSNEHVYVATGFNGNGMMLGTLSALVISDAILGKESPYSDLFDPSRIKPIASATDVITENLDVAYHFIADRFGFENDEKLQTLPVNKGCLVTHEGQKVAAYKNPQGNLQFLSPVCTHAKCIVNWNDFEKTWDCPCHGGRFDPNGNVLTGPPRKPLNKIQFDDPSK